ncbi:MAG: hypothetical protein VW338_01540 [Rhodospirillaceae bacterium]
MRRLGRERVLEQRDGLVEAILGFIDAGEIDLGFVEIGFRGECRRERPLGVVETPIGIGRLAGLVILGGAQAPRP